MPPHYSLGFHCYMIKINTLLPGFFYWVHWARIHHYDTPRSCHLHGMWLYHPVVMLYNWGNLLIFNCCVCWIFLLQCDGTECHQHHAIHLPHMIQERSRYFLHKCLVGFVQIWCLVFLFCVLPMCAIVWWYMLACLIFFPDQCFVMEPLQINSNIYRHGDVHFVSLLTPIKREYNIFLPSKYSNIP